MSLKDDPSCRVRPYSLIPSPVDPKGNRSCSMGHERFLGTRLSHSGSSILKWTQITTQLHADSPSKYLSLLPFRQAIKCYNISNIVVFVCLYRKLVGMLKRKENLTHSLTYLCSATYSINGKNSRFYPNTSNILALTRTSVSFVYVQTGQSFVPFLVRKLSNPKIRRYFA